MEIATATAPLSIPIAPNTKLEEILRIFDAQKKNFQNVKNTSVSERLKKMIDESGLFISDSESTTDTITLVNAGRKITDHVMEDMQKQLNYTPNEILENMNNKDYQESVRKIKEIREDY